MAIAWSAAAGSALLLLSGPGCSVSDGDGRVSGSLNVPDCWTGSFDLSPDFFAANYDHNTLQVRLQRGSDFENFSDGLTLLVNDVNGLPLRATSSVSLPAGVTPPGVPIMLDLNPSKVSATTYLQRTCRTQTVTLYAVKAVAVPTDGTCLADLIPGADPTSGCQSAAASTMGSGQSLVYFDSVYHGDPDGPASERLVKGCFDLYLADPRETPLGGGLPTCRGHLRGAFSFYFERGRPAQPFP
jgi:hypothetical protein